MQHSPTNDPHIGRACLRPARLIRATCTIVLLGACDGPVDFDLRDVGNAFDTTPALAAVPNRPRPDDRGVISYPTYQVAIAQRDDTVRSIAARLGLDAGELAGYNGIDADAPLRRDEVIALPARVAEPSPATGAVATGPILPASTEVQTTTLSSGVGGTAVPQTGVEPIRHRVASGETAFTIARLYGVDVQTLANWNGLGPDPAVREGQYLLVPTAGAVRPPFQVTTELPGTGSVAPTPPSAAQPLPAEVPVPASAPPAPAVAPDLGSTQTAAAPASQMVLPAQGSIIRAYAPGRNEGIDIGAAAGSAVLAAAAGTVAAITTDTAGIQILVIRHPDNLLTVYTHVANLRVERGATVIRGQTIAEVAPGNPSYVHFEVRRGTDSVDPSEFLP